MKWPGQVKPFSLCPPLSQGWSNSVINRVPLMEGIEEVDGPSSTRSYQDWSSYSCSPTFHLPWKKDMFISIARFHEETSQPRTLTMLWGWATLFDWNSHILCIWVAFLAFRISAVCGALWRCSEYLLHQQKVLVQFIGSKDPSRKITTGT